eukprot:4544818-Amphidinium_carterae.2
MTHEGHAFNPQVVPSAAPLLMAILLTLLLAAAAGIYVPHTYDQAAGSSRTNVPPDDPRLLDATADAGGPEEVAYTVPARRFRAKPLLSVTWPSGLPRLEALLPSRIYLQVSLEHRASKWEQQFISAVSMRHPRLKTCANVTRPQRASRSLKGSS